MAHPVGSCSGLVIRWAQAHQRVDVGVRIPSTCSKELTPRDGVQRQAFVGWVARGHLEAALRTRSSGTWKTTVSVMGVNGPVPVGSAVAQEVRLACWHLEQVVAMVLLVVHQHLAVGSLAILSGHD